MNKKNPMDLNGDGKEDSYDWVIHQQIIKNTEKKQETHISGHSTNDDGYGWIFVLSIILGLILEAIICMEFDWEIYDMSSFVVFLLWMLCSVVSAVIIFVISAIMKK